MISIFLTALLALLPVAQASVQSTFKTTCTFPNITTHYVSSPDTRGTLDILWSSLFTIIACTLTIQHLNVPEQRDCRDLGWWGDLKWLAKDTLRRLQWMMITILAPEVIIAQGCSDLVAAKAIHGRLRDQALVDKVPWTMTHTVFANMGGFVIRSNQQDVPSESKQVGEGGGEGRREAGEGANIELGLVRDKTPRETQPGTNAPLSFRNGPSLSLPPNPYHLTAIDILNLREHGQLDRLPCITQDEINDKSKANSFIKALAITQIGWMLIQILIRTAKNLTVTQLEISVLAFSVCAIIIYCLNWQKPKDVKIAHTAFRYPGEIPAETLRVLRLRTFGQSTSDSTLSMTLGLRWNEVLLGLPISNDYVHERMDSGADPFMFYLLGICLGCATFGGVHIAAWNFGFPTETEVIIWRAASIWCTFFAIFATALLSFFILFVKERIIYLILGLLSVLYVIGRLALLVEIFRTLLLLRPNAFVATLASNIPHVS